jgi:uncharacterized membrane protein (UPF0127 family)
MKVILRGKNRILVGNLTVADSFLTRLKGLLGKSSLGINDGLLLKQCKGVHTFGMKFSIDVIFLNRDNRIVEIIHNLKPNRITPIYSAADSVLELPAHKVSDAGLSKGDLVDFSTESP